jgi:hypothetical protein
MQTTISVIEAQGKFKELISYAAAQLDHTDMASSSGWELIIAVATAAQSLKSTNSDNLFVIPAEQLFDEIEAKKAIDR